MSRASIAITEEINGTHLTPPLKWAGGKRWLLPHLAPFWQEHKRRRLVEPFCGGLAVTLGLKPERALLNDVNSHLTNFYQQIQRNGLPITIKTLNDEKVFYKYRTRFNNLVTTGQEKTEEAAQLFYYLNRTCFNGLCRFNRSGEFNVPFGSYKTINYAEGFERYKITFQGWTITNVDFETIKVEPEDFIYADPPYDVDFTSYSAGGFSWEDQERTAEWVAKQPAPAILSNQATPRIIKLYKGLGFDLDYFDAPRRISCNGDRTAVKEVLARKGL